jgi:elongation factor Ts
MSPAITAAAVAALRARTGVPMLAVKTALEEAGGDEEKAIEILRKRGIAQAVKKSDRGQSEGAIFIAESNGKAALVVLKCETDFVARNPDFVSMGEAIAKAFLEGVDKGKSLADGKLPEAVQKLGENITLGETLEVQAPVIGTYVHSNRKIGVIIGMESGDVTKAKDISMHAAAMNPMYVSPEEVSADSVAKEREIWKEQMKNDKKPADILEKIMLGKEKKFREESSLLKQPFVKDSSMTVEKYLSGAKVTSYMRVAI